MLHIENITKVGSRRIFGGWVIRDINLHPTQKKYMFDVHCLGPVGTTIDRCTISLNRIGMVTHNFGKRDVITYFFNYNGEVTNVCGSSEWLGNVNNFLGQMEYIIQKYHNKK